MAESESQKSGVFAALMRLLRTIAAILKNRLELFQVEWQEERWRLFEALLLTGLVLILALMTLMVATVTIVIICVRNNQIGAVILLGFLYLAGAVGCGWRLRNRLRGWVPFAATLAELKKDKACLDNKR